MGRVADTNTAQPALTLPTCFQGRLHCCLDIIATLLSTMDTIGMPQDEMPLSKHSGASWVPPPPRWPWQPQRPFSASAWTLMQLTWLRCCSCPSRTMPGGTPMSCTSAQSSALECAREPPSLQP